MQTLAQLVRQSQEQQSAVISDQSEQSQEQQSEQSQDLQQASSTSSKEFKSEKTNSNVRRTNSATRYRQSKRKQTRLRERLLTTSATNTSRISSITQQQTSKSKRLQTSLNTTECQSALSARLQTS